MATRRTAATGMLANGTRAPRSTARPPNISTRIVSHPIRYGGGPQSACKIGGNASSPPGQLREAMRHEAVPDDQTQWDRSPTGDWRSADQADVKVAPRWRILLDLGCCFHLQSTFKRSMSPPGVGRYLRAH